MLEKKYLPFIIMGVNILLTVFIVGCGSTPQSTSTTTGVVITATQTHVHHGGVTTLEVTSHPFTGSGHEIHYTWEVHTPSATAGTFSPTNEAKVVYTPSIVGNHEIHATVHHEEGAHTHGASFKQVYLLGEETTNVATGEITIVVEEEH